MLEVVLVVFLAGNVPAKFSLDEYSSQFNTQTNARIEYHDRKREGKKPYVKNFLSNLGTCENYLRDIRLFYDKGDQSVRDDSFCLTQEIEETSKN